MTKKLGDLISLRLCSLYSDSIWTMSALFWSWRRIDQLGYRRTTVSLAYCSHRHHNNQTTAATVFQIIESAPDCTTSTLHY